MENSTTTFIGLVLSIVAAIVGSFAYLTGENRKLSVAFRRDLDNARDYFNSRIEGLSRNEAGERTTMRNDFVNSTRKLEDDLRRVSENMMRRTDAEALEGRVVRATERLEAKFDQIISRRQPRNPGDVA